MSQRGFLSVRRSDHGPHGRMLARSHRQLGVVLLGVGIIASATREGGTYTSRCYWFIRGRCVQLILLGRFRP